MLSKRRQRQHVESVEKRCAEYLKKKKEALNEAEKAAAELASGEAEDPDDPS